MKSQPVEFLEYEKAAASNEPMVCTSGHLHGALVAQTGEDFGYSVALWQKWWDTKGKYLEDWRFELNVAKKNKANKSREPTAMSVTPPAAQESRQP